MAYQEKDTGISVPDNNEAIQSEAKGRKRFEHIKSRLLQTWSRTDETLRDFAIKANVIICPGMAIGYSYLTVYHLVDGSPGKAAISFGTVMLASSLGTVALGLSGGLKRIAAK